MGRERFLVTVKTYPTLSRKYGETVCTAAVREDGSWLRIYPVPFRRLDQEQQYRKYDWLECDLIPNSSDVRPESHCPLDARHMVPVDHVGTEDGWRERRQLLLRTATVYESLSNIVTGAKANKLSLAVFKPKRVEDFKWEEEEEREWDQGKVQEMRNRSLQGDLFTEEWRKTFTLIPKLPYSFSYRFQDADGKRSTLKVLDWEVGALFWNCVKTCGGDESAALQKLRQKYFDEFLDKDLHFFLGTTQQFHMVAPNPWVIVGVLPIPHESQMPLL